MKYTFTLDDADLDWLYYALGRAADDFIKGREEKSLQRTQDLFQKIVNQNAGTNTISNPSPPGTKAPG